MFLQRTIKKKLSIEGIGLHTGKLVKMVFCPAASNTGICFVRTDLPGKPILRIRAEYIQNTEMATTLGKGNFSVSTIEHCMSVITAYRIDNLIIEIDGPEVPVCDGSALSFQKIFLEAGLVHQNEARKYMYIKKTVRYEIEDKYAYISPYNGLRIACTIDFNHPLIGRQFMDLDVNEKSFAKEIAPARTFGFLKDFEKLKSQGLALGASLENTIGLDEQGLVEGSVLRYPDEFVRHKILDALGDLIALGYPIMGQVVLYRAGHHILNCLIKKILSSPECYGILEVGKPIKEDGLLDNGLLADSRIMYT